MKATLSALLGAALLASPALGHTAIKPPSPDKALTPNSSEAPPGCKLLLSDKGWPEDSVWRSTFPGIFRKLKGTEAPDYMVQAKSVADVQKVVNFAREHNVRLTIITTGHDFGGRETGRSGLRLDMAALREPTVFSTQWKCGDSLKPTTVSGKVVEEVQACKVKKVKRSLSGTIPQRNHDYEFFEKRDGFHCDRLLRLRKRHGPDGDDDDVPAPAPAAASPEPAPAAEPEGHSHGGMEGMEGMEGMGGHGAPESVPAFNTITPKPGQPAYARVSAGMYNEMFFTQADKSGLMTLGAQHGGVSVLGGWMQAGGHNPFVHKFGMQVDNVVEIEVVTADGKFQKVSECNNPELFWALRGGGGSTFGVVTGATVRVFPTFPIVVSRFFVNSTDPGIFDAVAHFLQQGAKLRDQYGLQGYFYVYEHGFQSVLHMPDNFATLENAKKVTEPLMAEMEKLAKAKHIEPKYYQYKTYKEWYIAEMGDEEMEESGAKFLSYYDGSDGSVPAASDAMMNPLLMIPWAIKYPAGPQKRSVGMEMADVMRSQAMARTYLDSRLLSDKHVNSVSLKELSAAINATFPRIPGNHIRGFLYGGGEQAKPAKDAMGLLPAWRDATYHFIINAVPGNIRHDFDISPIAKLFPDAGAYVNEASPGEPNWKKVYWGEHYEKLEAIKKKVDPNNVFWCSPCVGADLLEYDDERLCKNPKYPQAGPAPQTYPNKNSTRGIASLPGQPGIPNPLMPIIQAYLKNGTLPSKMPKSNYFQIAMGEGGSALGKFSNMDPYHPGKELPKGEALIVDAPAAPPAPAAAPSASPPQGHSHSDEADTDHTPPAAAPSVAAPPPAAAAPATPKGSLPKTSSPKGSLPKLPKGTLPKLGSLPKLPKSSGSRGTPKSPFGGLFGGNANYADLEAESDIDV